MSATNQPGHGDFILYNSIPYDWRSPQNGNLWQGVNGINNPCPIGYRIPTTTEFNEERASWSSNNSSGGFNSSLKFTVAGARYYQMGQISDVAVNATYWSSNNQSDAGGGFYFNNNSAYEGSSARIHGFSVRCIKN